MSFKRSPKFRSFSFALAAVGAVAAPLLGCGTRPAPEPVPTPADQSIYAAPGTVASSLVEPGPDKDVRRYGEGNWRWSEYRESVGHAKHVGLAKVVCKDCHKQGYDKPGMGPCGRSGCHETEAKRTHGIVDSEEKTGCATCHSFRPGRPLPLCMDCHKEAQKRRVGEALPSIADGHAKADCGKCHNPHKDPISSAADCAGCHKEKSPLHTSHAKSKGCQDCHTSHAPSKAARAKCVECHKTPAGPKPAGHESCLTCHKPHAEHLPTGAICAGCHADKKALSASTVPKHADCESCHVAHEPKKVSDATSCQKCHAKVALGHAKAGAANSMAASGGPPSVNSCTACHPAHPKDVAQKVVACTSCHHAIAKLDKGAHATELACSACHSNHDFKAPAKASYATLCTKCHAAEAKKTSTNKGHALCGNCHVSTHKEAAAPACTTCHVAESSSAPKGHSACSTCHETHSGTLTAKAVCTSCHADRTKGPHETVKGGCQTCHRAHGPKGPDKPPTCDTCHKSSSLAGLHTAKGHVDCLKCHTSHAMPKADRASCTQAGCHETRKAHEPAATKCTGCHMFKPQH